MKASLHWLNRYLDRPATLDEAVQVLTRQGFPTEEWGPADGGAKGDQWMEVEVTSNRSDCLSHVGLARELACGTSRSLLPPDVKLPSPAGDPADKAASVRIDALDLCPLYTARIIRGVKVGPSPQWLVDALGAVGQPSVNNVVDVTNFVMLEMGQPLHAFDLSLLAGRSIIVRRASKGEPFEAIDGTKHTLRESMLVIADGERPVAMAGIMGGLNTEIRDSTTDVLLESARFDPLSTRRTSRALKLASDSSFRFERGVDPLGVDRASQRAAQLIIETAGGRLAPGVLREGAPDPELRSVAMRLSRCNALLGMEIPVDTLLGAFERLGLAPTHDQADQRVVCTIPSHRLDLEREVDLIEEAARTYGLDHVPVNERIEIIARAPSKQTAAQNKLAEVLTGCGFFEAVTFSFVRESHGRPFLAESAGAAMIEDERRKAEPMLRPSLLCSLMICRKANQDVGNSDVRLYEIGGTWTKRDGVIDERRSLGLIADANDPQLALRQMRTAVDVLVRSLCGGVDLAVEPLTGEAKGADGWPTSGLENAGCIRVNGEAIGVMGLISGAAQKAFDVQTRVAAAELALEPLLAGYPPTPRVQSLARFPGIERDLTVIVDEPLPWAKLETLIAELSLEKLESLRFLTTYRGKQIPSGKKAVSFRMTYRDPEATLRHEMVDPQVAAVVEHLTRQAGAEVRG